jgi:hypothetical protein
MNERLNPEYNQYICDNNQIKIADYKITPSIEKIIGSLHLDEDYKEIRYIIMNDKSDSEK